MASSERDPKDILSEGLCRIAAFWGFPRALGAVFSSVYLSDGPVSLGRIVEETGLTKGSVSTSVRTLTRMKLVRKHVRPGDRRDYYTAETEFWDIVRSILRQREDTEFDRAIGCVNESLAMLEGRAGKSPEDAFALDRVRELKRFFDQLDSLTGAILALDSARLTSMAKLFGGGRPGPA